MALWNFRLCFEPSGLPPLTKHAGQNVLFSQFIPNIFGFGYVCVCIYIHIYIYELVVHFVYFVVVHLERSSWELVHHHHHPFLVWHQLQNSLHGCKVTTNGLACCGMACCFWPPTRPPERTHTGHHIHSSCGFHRSRLDVPSETKPIIMLLLASLQSGQKNTQTPLPSVVVVVVVWRTTTYILLCSVGHLQTSECCGPCGFIAIHFFCTFACSTVHTPTQFFFVVATVHAWMTHLWGGRVFKAFVISSTEWTFCGFHPFPCRKNHMWCLP